MGSSALISLHVALNGQTRYLIDENSIRQMKTGGMLINTSRGGKTWLKPPSAT